MPDIYKVHFAIDGFETEEAANAFAMAFQEELERAVDNPMMISKTVDSRHSEE